MLDGIVTLYFLSPYISSLNQGYTLVKNSLRLLAPMSAFLIAVSLSTIIASTNKVQAVFSYTYGPLILAILMVFYWYMSQEEDVIVVDLMIRFSALCTSLITMILFFHPFDNVALPKTFQFLINRGFSPIGTQSDLMLFLIRLDLPDVARP